MPIAFEAAKRVPLVDAITPASKSSFTCKAKAFVILNLSRRPVFIRISAPPPLLQPAGNKKSGSV
ncbi:MAG: hypothetical protein IPI12_09455 [Ignavibacteriales bacterium]|nr:hypothetical protein [Ignavibacteriales bacterium]